MTKERIKTDYWTKDTPEIRVKPYWTITVYAMVNIGHAIIRNNVTQLVVNIVFALTGILAIISYNKYKKKVVKQNDDNQNRQTGKEIKSN